MEISKQGAAVLDPGVVSLKLYDIIQQSSIYTCISIYHCDSTFVPFTCLRLRSAVSVGMYGLTTRATQAVVIYRYKAQESRNLACNIGSDILTPAC